MAIHVLFLHQNLVIKKQDLCDGLKFQYCLWTHGSTCPFSTPKFGYQKLKLVWQPQSTLHCDFSIVSEHMAVHVLFHHKTSLEWQPQGCEISIFSLNTWQYMYLISHQNLVVETRDLGMLECEILPLSLNMYFFIPKFGCQKCNVWQNQGMMECEISLLSLNTWHCMYLSLHQNLVVETWDVW